MRTGNRSAPTATNDYYSYNTNNTFPGAANLVQNIDATEAMKQVEGEAGGGSAGGGQLDPSIPASIALGGGFVGGLGDSYKYGNHTVKYAQRINGQVRNAKVLTRASQMNAAKMVSGLKVVGRGVTVLSIATAGYQFATSDMSGNDYARLTGSFVITGTAFIPIVGPVISIGLGVADSYDAFDNIYNYFE